MTEIAKLAPQIVWEHFQTLCDIPRPSKHEGQILEYLKSWAELKGLATHVDCAGNLIIRKNATPGMEDRAGVVLQGHLDMVCQANEGTDHDFFKDPIRPILKDGWLIAENTTLGADNGIGVAFALAVLDSDDIQHGPIEVLLTVDEEAGMGGAQGLEPGLLSGELLINIDTEEWGEFYLGCAGGEDVNAHASYIAETLPSDYVGFKIVLKGLTGGHSGADIHLGRGNANKLLLRVLTTLPKDQWQWLSFQGGTARNALSREAQTVIAVAPQLAAELSEKLAELETLFKFELADIDEGVRITCEAATASVAMSTADTARVLATLHAMPHGVKRMSQRVEGVVETSNNLGIVVIGDGKVYFNAMVRSLLDSGTGMLADEIQSLMTLGGFEVEREGRYPGWAPNPNSDLLKHFHKVFKQTFNETAKVQVIHAGLECGLLGSKYPNMDMISFGPNIRGAHAPGERVELESVDYAWTFLKEVLAQLPAR